MDQDRKAFPIKRQEELKWNGWGYRDSKFEYHSESDTCTFSGSRYPMAGITMPYLMQWFKNDLGANPSDFTPPQPLDLSKIPHPIRNVEFMEAARPWCKLMTEDAEDRLMHGHGHLCEEIFMLRNNMYHDQRIPDLVVYPSSHEDVVQLVKLAAMYNVVLIPMGGGTSVSGALMCPKEETRTIVSLDMTEMNRIHWIDPENHMAHIEAGIIGQDLERRLEKEGYTTGHQPDSLEFSSLGGWVATRASGMKKNLYGNIEDMVVRIKMVTAKGTIEKSCQVPRISAGPDVHEFILGSEGTLGVITEVTLKIKPLPECTKYGSLIFPDFEKGIKFMQEVAKQKIYPASIRLMDNAQLRFGLALKPEKGLIERFTDHIKQMYITRLRGFNPEKVALCTAVFEGPTDRVNKEEADINRIAAEFGAIPAGEANGKNGYLLTFSIAYLRDLGMNYGFLAESFETSVPWDRVSDLIKNVKQRIIQVCKEQGVREENPPYSSARVTQCYDTGACCYFYFGFYAGDLPNPLEAYSILEKSAREEVLANGGSVSHHHGIGKVRAQFLEDTISKAGKQALLAVKQGLDPQNIFGCGNLTGVVGPTGALKSKL